MQDSFISQQSWMHENHIFDQRQGHLREFHHKLLTAYAEKRRAYHTLDHIHALLCDAQSFRESIQDWLPFYWAIWYHDVIYVAGSSSNEERSARLAQTHLAQLNASQEMIGRVAQLIRATKDHALTADDADGTLFLDLDMAILAAEPERYDRYTEEVAYEFRKIPKFLYRRGRRKFLEELLKRPAIFLHPMTAQRFEAKARDNIQRELQK